MKMLIAIPVMGQYEIGRISLYCFDQLVSPETDFLLIDNTPDHSPYVQWKQRYHMTRWAHLLEHENLGLVKSCQMAYEFALEERYDILTLTHNDVWVYLQDWDKLVMLYFKKIDRLGGVGLFGSKGCDREGHRLDTFGSLIEMDGHGKQVGSTWGTACTFDGFFMAFSMEMLKDAGGFDQRYQWHHMYDLDASLTSIRLGYKNIVANIPCHHLSGLTANNDAKLTSGPEIHTANALLWREKWASHLGVSVDEDFNYRWNQ